MDRELIEKQAKSSNKEFGGGTCACSRYRFGGSPTASAISASKAVGVNWIRTAPACTVRKPSGSTGGKRAGVCFNARIKISRSSVYRDIDRSGNQKGNVVRRAEESFQRADDPLYCVLLFRPERYCLLIDGRKGIGVIPQSIFFRHSFAKAPDKLEAANGAGFAGVSHENIAWEIMDFARDCFYDHSGKL